MTAATSEYAMLDSMFAMDPVFPGLGGLDGMDQPMQLDQQFVNPSWDSPTRPQTANAPSMNPTQQQSNYSTSLPNPAPAQQQQQRPSAATAPGINTMLTTPPTYDLPSSPWTTWVNSQVTGVDGSGAAATAAGLLAGGSGKKTMSSSEVYKTVTKP